MKLSKILTEKNWRKNLRVGQRCIALALCRLPHQHWDIMRQVIAELFPERGQKGIVLFNDHPDTTVEDVLRVCKTADV